MVEDSDECYFRSALRAFERRVVYSNIIKDYIVGWRTTSVREDRENVPILIGKTILEKIARIIALCIVGKIGRHLFLTDGTERTHSLLLRMVECYLRHALRAFESRVLYSNVIKDCNLYISIYWKCIRFLNCIYIFIWCSFIITSDIVGWRTASIRNNRENVKLKCTLNEKYSHVVYEEDCHARDEIGSHNIHDEMVRGLSCVSWQKVDVILNSGCLIKFQAHSLIQVSMHGVSPLTSDGLVLLSLLTHCTLVPPLINSSWKTSDSNPC